MTDKVALEFKKGKVAASGFCVNVPKMAAWGPVLYDYCVKGKGCKS